MGAATPPKKKFFQKGLDKPGRIWYNQYVNKRRKTLRNRKGKRK